MSDNDGPLSGTGGNDDELTLPKATVNKYITGTLQHYASSRHPLSILQRVL